jgi:flagellar biogenesis protein FliO
MSGTVTFIFAFVVVLGLIGLAAWLVRRFASNRLGANTNRGRMPRLAVIDAAAVDGRRRLVLVRRDNVEHLLMIGGPTDIVVESNIVRATAGREALPQRPTGAEAPPRIAPMATMGMPRRRCRTRRRVRPVPPLPMKCAVRVRHRCPCRSVAPSRCPALRRNRWAGRSHRWPVPNRGLS